MYGFATSLRMPLVLDTNENTPFTITSAIITALIALITVNILLVITAIVGHHSRSWCNVYNILRCYSVSVQLHPELVLFFMPSITHLV